MPYVDLEPVLRDSTWDDLPTSVQGVLANMELYVPDDPEAAEGEVYSRAQAGHCMTCDGELKDLTMLCINRAGVIMIFCCGQCYTDMQITGWIEEVYEDIVQKIKFRGGKGDELE
jgi:hypothetical protein